MLVDVRAAVEVGHERRPAVDAHALLVVAVEGTAPRDVDPYPHAVSTHTRHARAAPEPVDLVDAAPASARLLDSVPGDA